MTKRAAFFCLWRDTFGRPMDDGVIGALLDSGFEVDVFAPRGDGPQQDFPPAVRRLAIDYRMATLERLVLKSFASRYDLFLGTPDVPVAFAGALAARARRPCVTVCDEIFVGGYTGAARTRYWLALTRWAMRRARFTVITDRVRIPLQRAFAGLSADHPFLEYPSCYAGPYGGSPRSAMRETLGIGADEFVLSFTGALTVLNGADWAIRYLDLAPAPARLLVQPGASDAVMDSLLARDPKVIHRPARLRWLAAAEITNAADVSLALYLSPAPQAQAMGVSSQKLCMSLWLGIPVVATRQPSFAFVEEYECGELIDGEAGLVPAIERIRGDRERYGAGASRAVSEYIRAPEKRHALAGRFAQL